MEAENFDRTLTAFKRRSPFRPFTVALVIRDGVAVYVAAGGVPVLFDHEGVSQVVGDLTGQSNA
jgi:hypothetical protein